MKPPATSILQRLLAAAGMVWALLIPAGATGFTLDPDELLDAKVAFAISVSADRDTVLVDYKIAEGYYLYRHAFKFIPVSEGITLGEPVIPRGEEKIDDYFGEVETYRQNVSIRIPYTYSGAKLPGMFELQATSQGCADLGVCYPPLAQTVAVLVNETANITAAAAPAPLAEQDRLAALLKEGISLATLFTFFALGLGLALTPCVFPMIPILSSIVVGQGKSISTGKAFVISTIYVLSMALVYTAAGVIVGLVAQGQEMQAMFQKPWILGSFAGVFVLLALAMFGFYELQLPASLQSRLANISNSQQGGTFIGAAVMGMLSALIVGPCITAPLIGVLLYIADTGDPYFGGLALFALSLGMGFPLVIIGTSAGKLLPKAGAWMDAVKSVFGVLLLGVAIWFLERILPVAVTMGLYAALLIASGIYLGALEPIPAGRSAWFKLWKAIGLMLLIYGAALAVGALSGGKSLLQPLKGLTAGQAQYDSHPAFRPIKGLSGLQQALEEAKLNRQPVMLDFYADWCVSCKEMEAFTFPDPEVQAALTSFLLIQADVTANDEEDAALLKQLGLYGPPAILFYDLNGREIPGHRVVGYKKASDFLAHLNKVKLAI